MKRFEAEKVRFEQARKNPDASSSTSAPRAPRAPWRPSELYNAMAHPLIPYAIKGAIWYQGEANAGRARQYRTLFPDMIRNWRTDWQQRFTGVPRSSKSPIFHSFEPLNLEPVPRLSVF